jgi:hypothetical protein
MPEAADPVQEIAELRALLAEREAELAEARAELTSKDVHDGSQVGPLLEQIAGPVTEVAIAVGSRWISGGGCTFAFRKCRRGG